MPKASKVYDASAATIQSASDLTGVSKVRDVLSAQQVKLRANKRFRSIVVATTMLAVFVDILGTAMTVPVLPSICGYARGGQVSAILNNPQITAAGLLASGSSSTSAPTPDTLATIEKIRNSQGVAQLRAAGQLANFDAASSVDQFARLAVVEHTVIPYAFGGPVGGTAPPLPYALSMNVVLSLGQLGSAGGSLFFGFLSDKVGCKIPIQTCLFMGIFGYLFMIAGGLWTQSYYLYSLGIVWNNFFGNTMGIASTYFNLLIDGPEKGQYVSGVMSMGLLGGAIGAFIVIPFVSNPSNGANFFYAVWLALGLTVLMFLLVTFILVAPEKKDKEESKEPPKTPKYVYKILIITIIASGLDSGGDEGTRMARGTILTALYPEWGTTNQQNILLILLLGIVFIALALLAAFRKCANLGVIAVFGCLCTLTVQLILAFSQQMKMSAISFIIIWMCGKCFGFLSTFAANFLVMEIAPKQLLGTWSGRNDAVTNLVSAATPILFSAVYDGVGNTAGTEMLMATSAISLLAVLAYAPLMGMLPKPKPKSEKPLELDALGTYETMSDLDWAQLPLEMVDKVQDKQLEAGQAPRMVMWGTYQNERPFLMGLTQRAEKDFKYIKSKFMEMLSDRDKMLKTQEEMRKVQGIVPKPDRDKAKAEMGAWIADYFDDAGYVNWETHCQIYKTMIMTAFPPIDPLDDAKPDFAEMPIDQLEDNLIKFLGVMDEHLAASQRRFGVKVTPESLLNMLRRR